MDGDKQPEVYRKASFTLSFFFKEWTPPLKASVP